MTNLGQSGIAPWRAKELEAWRLADRAWEARDAGDVEDAIALHEEANRLRNEALTEKSEDV